MKENILALLALFPLITYASEVDYLGLMEKMQLMSQMAVSAKSCEQADMVIDWEAINKMPEDLIAEAVVTGMNLDMATGLIEEALRKQRESEKFLFDFYKNKPERSKEYIDYWGKRCADLAGNLYTQKFIKFPVK